MKKTYDLAVKTGSYQKDGETKNRYENIGSIMENDKGQFMILNRTFNPAGVPNPDNKSSIVISMFSPQTAQNGSSKVQDSFNGSKVDNPFNDSDVPF
jgi:hypothetical protein